MDRRTVQGAAPWVAIVLALAGPTFSWLEAREARMTARESKGEAGAGYEALRSAVQAQAERVALLERLVLVLAGAPKEAPKPIPILPLPMLSPSTEPDAAEPLIRKVSRSKSPELPANPRAARDLYEQRGVDL